MNDSQKVRDTFSAFLGPVINAGVPFAATYGNHDFQCGILPDEQDDIYREFPGCLNPEADAAGGSPLAIEPGTFRAARAVLRRLGACGDGRDAGQFRRLCGQAGGE